MNVGAIQHPFLVQANYVVQDGQGGIVSQWSTVSTLWGSLEPLAFERAVTPSAATHHVITRYRPDFEISTSHRLALDGRMFQIVHVVMIDEVKRWLRLTVVEQNYLN